MQYIFPTKSQEDFLGTQINGFKTFIWKKCGPQIANIYLEGGGKERKLT